MRFLVVSGYGYWGDFTPNDLISGDKQVGGGETAMVSISRELAKLGHEVIVFYDVNRPGCYDGVDYLPTNMFVPMITQMRHDVLVGWDSPHAFRFADKADIRICAFQLNDAIIGSLDWTIDYYFHPSKWHADRFTELYPEMSKDKIHYGLTNGVNYDRYLVDDPPERNPYRVIHSSSPDRGLHHLLKVWPEIVEEIPEAELHVFYDMDKWLTTIAELEKVGFITNTTERGKIIQAMRENAPESIHFHGGVGQRTLAIEQLKSAVMAYPCDPVQPTEGFSMSILEGIAAGCDVITTDADALPELWSNAPGVVMLPNPVDSTLWVKTIVDKLRNGSSPNRAPNVRTDLSWASVARRWEDICLKDKET